MSQSDKINGWTAETILRLQTDLAAEREKRYDERADAQKELASERDKRYTERAQSQDKAVSAALDAANQLRLLAESNAEKWRVNANEWRDAMNDRERNFLSKGMGYVVGALSAIALLLTILGKLPG